MSRGSDNNQTANITFPESGQMTKYLRKNREDIKAKIYAKLELGQADDDGIGESGPAQVQLEKTLLETEKKKAAVRKLISTSTPHHDFSDQMAQLKWRIDALKHFSKDKRYHPESTSLTGQPERSILPEASTFDELLERQRKKFALLRERRKSKTSDPRYIEMLGNLQERKEKRKLASKAKVERHFRTLNDHISGESSSGVE